MGGGVVCIIAGVAMYLVLWKSNSMGNSRTRWLQKLGISLHLCKISTCASEVCVMTKNKTKRVSRFVGENGGSFIEIAMYDSRISDFDRDLPSTIRCQFARVSCRCSTAADMILCTCGKHDARYHGGNML